MSKNIAIIDLGTNTFHLLVIRVEAGNYERLYKESRYVKLAEGGMDLISASAYQRALDTLVHYKTIIDMHQVERIYAFGTAALRTAENGAEFIHTVKERTHITIQLISGDQEAEWIAWGVRQAVPIADEIVLIMDIGGGSVEFIFANRNDILWKQSYPIGAALLKNKFHLHDRMEEKDEDNLIAFLEKSLSTLTAMIDYFPVHTLIGASGTFDTIVDIQLAEQANSRNGALNMPIDIDYFYALKERLTHTTLAERLLIQGMPEQRAEMIVGAMILIDYILKQFPIKKIIQSEYAIKEGILWGVLNNKI